MVKLDDPTDSLRSMTDCDKFGTIQTSHPMVPMHHGKQYSISGNPKYNQCGNCGLIYENN